ncbi:MAG: ATP-binding protein [Ginsengibacter sp.]
MKTFLFISFLFLSLVAKNQTHKLEKVWETDSIVAVPESVLADTKNGILYVSLINGSPWESDGKGGIAKLSPDGAKYDSTWVTGLNAPKGLGIYNNDLYVADINEVVVIDVAKGTIKKRIPIDSATGLNDISISDKGIVYVSDSKTTKIWRIEKDEPALYLENMQGVNGLKAVKEDLIIAAGKTFLKADAQKRITNIAEIPQSVDGIEPVGNGDYIVSSWSGYIFYVYANGKVETLVETHEQKRNTADIGYDPVKKMVYVPTFFAKTVSAYQLK